MMMITKSGHPTISKVYNEQQLDQKYCRNELVQF